jgi:hypothetical protein
MYAGLTCSTMLFIIGFVFLFSLNRMATTCAVDKMQADMLLVTLDDYAVEIDLDAEIYETFRDKNREKAI